MISSNLHTILINAHITGAFHRIKALDLLRLDWSIHKGSKQKTVLIVHLQNDYLHPKGERRRIYSILLLLHTNCNKTIIIRKRFHSKICLPIRSFCWKICQFSFENFALKYSRAKFHRFFYWQLFTNFFQLQTSELHRLFVKMDSHCLSSCALSLLFSLL